MLHELLQNFPSVSLINTVSRQFLFCASQRTLNFLKEYNMVHGRYCLYFFYYSLQNLTMNRNQMLLGILKAFIDRTCTNGNAIFAKYCSILKRLIIKALKLKVLHLRREKCKYSYIQSHCRDAIFICCKYGTNEYDQISTIRYIYPIVRHIQLIYLFL